MRSCRGVSGFLFRACEEKVDGHSEGLFMERRWICAEPMPKFVDDLEFAMARKRLCRLARVIDWHDFVQCTMYDKDVAGVAQNTLTHS